MQEKMEPQILSGSKNAQTACSNLRSQANLTLLDNSIRAQASSSSSDNKRRPLLLVPNERFGRINQNSARLNDLFHESTNLIRNSLVSLGSEMVKSFSTSDLTLTPEINLRLVSSDSNLSIDQQIRRVDSSVSHSCSTWAITGDRLSSISQLPSPRANSAIGTVSPIDVLITTNNRIRKLYIRKRLLSTYKALERLSSSQLDLNNVINSNIDSFPSKVSVSSISIEIPEIRKPSSVDLTSFVSTELRPITLKEVERQKGKPLTKYERNILIFNWLRNADNEITV